ncbi:MAG: NAD(P)/FAD-dependent oxidoreductase [Spirochaetes bacterium]|nr:NAD(P)/FAD-dependent oxidoreductase [Spirochaetota bacterium]
MKKRKTHLSSDYDVVIVGGGNGGLTAGCKLAAKGVKTLILEKNNLPGGYASSFVRGRFEFETALHAMADLGSPENPGAVRKLFDEIGIEPEWAFLPDVYHLVLPEDGVDGILPTGVDAYIDGVDALVPGHKKELHRYFALCNEVMDALNYIEAHMDNLNKLYLLKRFPNFIRTAAYTVEEVTERCFNLPEEVLDILYAYWGYLGVPTTHLNFTIWAAMLSMYHDKKAYVPKYRSHDISMALAERYTELGGRIELNTPVEKILVDGGRVTGVETSHGDMIRTNHVIANVAPHAAYGRLVHPRESVPEIAYRYCNSRELGITLVSVFLGLDISCEELGMTDYEYFISDTMRRDRRYVLPTEPTLPQRMIVSCINAVVPEASPPGTCILNLSITYEADVWNGVKAEEYVALKQRLADQMIEKAEKTLHLSIRPHIEEIEIATPMTMAHYAGHTKGAVYGYKTTVWDSLIPRNLCIEEEQYIKNLEFVGGFSFRGVGYCSSYVSGSVVAEGILKKLGGRG